MPLVVRRHGHVEILRRKKAIRSSQNVENTIVFTGSNICSVGFNNSLKSPRNDLQNLIL